VINTFGSFLAITKLDLIVEDEQTLLLGDGRVFVGEAEDEGGLGVGGAYIFVWGSVDGWMASEGVGMVVWETAGRGGVGRHG
jgi:hypothetical protein